MPTGIQTTSAGHQALGPPAIGWLAAALVIVLLTTAACTEPPRPRVVLASRVNLETRQPRADRPSASPRPLRVGIASTISPKETLRSYLQLTNYLAGRLGEPTELLQRSTYGELNALIRAGGADVAFVSPLVYVEGRGDFGMELLAAPAVNGYPEYYSYVIVPTRYAARSLLGLRGQVFAFTDPLSTSGWLAPTYALARSDETAGSFFRSTIYTYSHDNSIQAVANRVVDGAAVSSIVFESTMNRMPDVRSRLRVVTRIGPFPTPPVVSRPGLDDDTKARLSDVLLTMHQDPTGQGILVDLGIDRYVAVNDRVYDDVRATRDAAQKAGRSE